MIIGIICIAFAIWVAYEIKRAPLVDENENIINKDK